MNEKTEECANERTINYWTHVWRHVRMNKCINEWICEESAFCVLYLESKNEYISMGCIETVNPFSILSPSYMRERDTWLTELLYSEGNSSSKLTYRHKVYNIFG